uniref:Apolipoprotein B mRNA editing enzyme catalytic polypeptide-like 3Z2A isomer C n=1 Tax=Pteropus alecto TaxID=9402 RepID=A0A2R2Z4G0_PTEAL|nr:apolipoprotein B mRNA editing enzyme catalytic polypeptide-like 3Z2A isomer C [Pteropus alecto]
MHLQVWRKVTEAWREGYTLKPWSRNPMERLYHDYFYFHFYNLPTPKHRNGCYICYQVEGTKNHSRMPLLRGVFENQGLRKLHDAGVHVAIMSYYEFKHCLNDFVFHQGRSFCPWNDLNKNSKNLSNTLEDILRNQED